MREKKDTPTPETLKIKGKIAIAPFEIKDGDSSLVNKIFEILHTELTEFLERNKGIKLVLLERSQLEKIIRELKTRNPEDILKLFQEKAVADYIILGSIIKEDGNILICARIVKIKTGEVIKAAKVNFSENLVETCRELIKELFH